MSVCNNAAQQHKILKLPAIMNIEGPAIEKRMQETLFDKPLKSKTPVNIVVMYRRR